jgi:4-aminobutyrate aminotransferase-like enzyme
MNLRELLFRQIAQTSPSPLAFQVEKAEGVWLYGSNGEKLLDLISGIAVSNIGHRQPRVVEAIREQSERYFHALVYGDMIQCPQVRLSDSAPFS